MEILFIEEVAIGVGALFWFFAALALVTGIAAMLIDLDEHGLLAIIMTIIAITNLSIMIWFGCSRSGADTETHYHVTIDDSVLMTEFYEKYEVIEQKGDIYIIKERD